jgi:multidrug efflux system membrane fusion protein
MRLNGRTGVVGLHAVAFAAALALAACSSKPAPTVDPAVPVVVATAGHKAVPELVDAVGTVETINSVQVKSLVDGQLLESHVHDGDEVAAGQLLFRIDARPAQAALAQAQAALARDIAARDLAKAQVDRYQPVADKHFLSADQMQQYLTAYSAAATSVKVDQANVDAARLTLGYTEIRSPIAGRAGRVLVQPGNLVKANDTQPLLVINQLAPIYVSFAVPGRLVERIRAAQGAGPLDVRVAVDGGADEHGVLAFVDNAVDPATNTVKLRARFDNGSERLWPGQFVDVARSLGSGGDAVVVPDAAVKAGPDGNYVFVIKADGRAEQRAVAITRSVAGESLVARGVAAGERVVVDGQSRLVDGTRVRIVDATAAVELAESEKSHHEDTKNTKKSKASKD